MDCLIFLKKLPVELNYFNQQSLKLATFPMKFWLDFVFAMEIFTDAFEQFITIHFSDNTPTDSTSQMDFVRFIFKVKNGHQIFTSVTDVYTQSSRSIEVKNLELFCQKIQWASLKLTTQFIDEMEHFCSVICSIARLEFRG